MEEETLPLGFTKLKILEMVALAAFGDELAALPRLLAVRNSPFSGIWVSEARLASKSRLSSLDETL